MKRRLILGSLVIAIAAIAFNYVDVASAQKQSEKQGRVSGSLSPSDVPLLVENFTYAPGSLLTANGWTAHSGAGTNAIATEGPGLTYTGYPSSGVGNQVSMTTSGEDVNRVFTVQSSGAVYAAYMVNISEAAIDATGIGGYFFHLGPDPISTTFRGRVYVKKDAGNNVAFGISKATSSVLADITYTPFTYSLNTTYLMVVKYTVVAGATNDTVDLFINPSLASEPAATISAPDFIASDINPGSVALRQGSTATAPTIKLDGIRVGTTWASVAQPATAADANADFNGDGKTDFIVARGTNTPLAEGLISPLRGADQEVKGRRSPAGSTDSPAAPTIYWYSNINGTGTTSVQPLGDAATDFIVTEDFDGDGKDDITVWREAPATQAAFYILRSSTGTVDVQLFGQTGDDPAVVGDYDGDNKADVAVYRCPAAAAPAGQCYFFYRGSNANPGGNVTFVPWGFGNDGFFYPYVGDFDGDGKNDFCIQRTDPTAPANGQFVLLKSNGFGVEFINWGTSSDFLIPGDYDGDGKTDFCVRRTVSNARHHWILTRTGATSFTIWGQAGDSSVPGDYDGDGKTDLAIWRGSTDPAANYFWVLNSSNGAVGLTEWGQCPTVGTCDFAVAGWAVH
ncbi:MAG: VCBS repeat-containing protein [Pyrinomonadaceae bacterium]|nr:VCBS repeat-containing protein [Pyrinomonadaceae bacterium]MBP6213802.1 VCBS repeat-containing protein [Pyrinomonadaceae bacterium]